MTALEISQSWGGLKADAEVPLGGETWSTPAVVRCDGRTLIVAVDRAGWITAIDGRDRSLIWRHYLGAEITASPTIFDLDADGRPEIIIGTHGGELLVFRTDGSVLWRRDFRDVIRATVAVADVGQTGSPMLFVAIYGPLLIALKPNGQECWRRRLPNHLFAGPMKRGVVSSPLLADVDRDGILEVVVGIRSSRIFCVDTRDGRIKWFAKLAYDPDSTPSFTIDENGRPLVILGGGEHTGGEGDNAIIALDGRNGQRVWTAEVGGGVDSSPMLLDRPGRSSVAIACSLARPAVVAVDISDGRLLWRHEFGPTSNCVHGTDHRCRPHSGVYFTEHAVCRSYTTPLLADINGDGRVEVVAGSNNGELVALDAETGHQLSRISMGAMVRGSPIIADLDDDGFGELVVAAGDGLAIIRTRHVGHETTMFKGRADHLGSTIAPPPVIGVAPRQPPRAMAITIFWRLVVQDVVRHAMLKVDKYILRRFGLQIFRYHY
ncbi:PQQ-binding-like beta-propeller repeat protein [Bradyrhizobium sp. 4]|uniref:outer membrane protein assembly factor BamB family protein n=1 Tax=unclassified Bradyrhizobium TaxID=2631580 RepID=UPI001FFAEC16|nr:MULTISPECIES: PQQ-binding-like beta-propeller repeat protein [unclassified Bradyrhizobium]MCK1397433.1 PQQ-binding-like beta-propeller repeat protein [Bradyrhizobium sp. 39]MCK1752528.1 PQQ-binding-like beta-propeller repeat protein [Bradyrhizobium sp. 135]UPJ36747.1 PQQ-binding-like beta-propeller repeat protein [Bradyrhizobium sp. 4]